MGTPTKQRITKLHPSARKEVTKIITQCDVSLIRKAKIRITQSPRTNAEQDVIYAQGRTVPSKKITNTKAGQFIHNYGFAVDMCLIINGKTASWDTKKDWDNDQIADWYEYVKIFALSGWEWGGNWKTFKDMPHFEKQNLNSWKKLSMLKKDKNGYQILSKK